MDFTHLLCSSLFFFFNFGVTSHLDQFFLSFILMLNLLYIKELTKQKNYFDMLLAFGQDLRVSEIFSLFR